MWVNVLSFDFIDDFVSNHLTSSMKNSDGSLLLDLNISVGIQLLTFLFGDSSLDPDYTTIRLGFRVFDFFKFIKKLFVNNCKVDAINEITCHVLLQMRYLLSAGLHFLRVNKFHNEWSSFSQHSHINVFSSLYKHKVR